MFDRDLVLSILLQIDQALERIKIRAAPIRTPDDFTGSQAGMEKLDSICMLFMAIGEALKNVDKITGGGLLSEYPEIDWKGAIGFRDIIAHHYFDIDAEQVLWVCVHEVGPLSTAVKNMIKEMRNRTTKHESS